MKDLSKFKCDECGACCKGHLIIEIQHLDAVREPKLLEHAEPMSGFGPVDSPWEKEYMLSCTKPCGLLGPDNRCGIYPSRPNVCVAFEAGCGKCQESRERFGLPYLADIDGVVPTQEEVRAHVEEENNA